MLETREIYTGDSARKVIAAVQTDPGCVREANEDSGRHISPNDKEVRTGKGTLTIVADGMGGHASGEVASQMAVDIISELYYSENCLTPPEALRNAIEVASEEIYEVSVSSEEHMGMGTTVIALVLQNDTGFYAHVGDSRLYRLRAGNLEMLTIDHSQVMEMVKQGVITMEQARDHEDKNVILRAVGTQGGVEVELSEIFKVELGDTFLLCSDGLSDMLENVEIEAILNDASDLHTACTGLISAAKYNGGHDNITAGLVRIAEQDTTIASDGVRVTREFEALA
ncbi:MAG: Stp1/IreP family PP2C-type Ser/Thr phosphatase [Pyrinomonadaceae bacterium]